MNGEKLSERKQKIIKAVVEEYISNGDAVASGSLQKNYLIDISSATIRNELSALEEMGYLKQLHVSGGRVPTKKAYELYVDKFIQKKALTTKEMAVIENSFKNRFNAVEDIVRTTAKLISDITNYTSVVVLNNLESVTIKEIKMLDLDEHTALVVIVTDSGIIRDKVIAVDKELNEGYVKDAQLLINKIFAGRRISEINEFEAYVNEEREEFREIFESIVQIVVSYATPSDSSVYLEGQSKFIDDKCKDIAIAKDFLEAIDTKEHFAELMTSGDTLEFNVKIGKDEKGGIDNCAIVSANYKYNGKDIGCAGVIGPERMDYGKVIGVLDYIKKTLNEIDDGGKNGKK